MNVTDYLSEQLRPFVELDDSGELAILLGAISVMLQPLVDLVSDDDEGRPGWSPLVDIDRYPAWLGLGYIAQFVGVRLLPGLADPEQRDRIRSTDGWQRGKPSAIVGAAQQSMTGDKRVVLRERYNTNTSAEDAYWFQVITYEPETPDPDAVVRDVLAQKPGGLNVTFTVAAGQDWQQLKDHYGSWQAVKDAYDDWQAVRDDVPAP